MTTDAHFFFIPNSRRHARRPFFQRSTPRAAPVEAVNRLKGRNHGDSRLSLTKNLHTTRMKIVLSLPDSLVAEVDSLAAKLRVRRSWVCTAALERFVRTWGLTAQVNAYIEAHGQPTDPISLTSSLNRQHQALW